LAQADALPAARFGAVLRYCNFSQRSATNLGRRATRIGTKVPDTQADKKLL
jgi:hypothetical protein